MHPPPPKKKKKLPIKRTIISKLLNEQRSTHFRLDIAYFLLTSNIRPTCSSLEFQQRGAEFSSLHHHEPYGLRSVLQPSG